MTITPDPRPAPAGPGESDGPPPERPLPIDLAQLPDETLTRISAEATRILAARNAAALPTALLAAWDREHPGAPLRPASVTLTATDYGNGGYWDLTTATAHFTDDTTLPWHLSDPDARTVLTKHENDTEPADGNRLVVTFDPPAVTFEH